MPTFSEFEKRVYNHAQEHQTGRQLTFTLSSCDRCYPLTIHSNIELIIKCILTLKINFTFALIINSYNYYLIL